MLIFIPVGVGWILGMISMFLIPIGVILAGLLFGFLIVVDIIGVKTGGTFANNLIFQYVLLSVIPVGCALLSFVYQVRDSIGDHSQ
jgi:hypothetical protein